MERIILKYIINTYYILDIKYFASYHYTNINNDTRLYIDHIIPIYNNCIDIYLCNTNKINTIEDIDIFDGYIYIYF